MNGPLVRVEGLVCHFDVSGGWLARTLSGAPRSAVRAVDGVDLEIEKGETFALVGESGSGKSTLGRLIVGLETPTAGSIRFDGVDLGRADAGRARQARRRMQMIFQDPYASLNPRWRVRSLVAEPLQYAVDGAAPRGREEIAALLARVGLAARDGDKFPHEFSGGQRQRICIARALAAHAEFIVCDEPTSALDVSVQAQILNLMAELQRDFGLTYLFISHNLAVVSHMAGRVGVLYLGRLCETGSREQIFERPRHPYTRMLLDSIPDLSLSGRPRTPVQGEVPSAIRPPPGCGFHPRCPHSNARCRIERPELRRLRLQGAEPQGSEVWQTGTEQRVACHAVEEGRL
jgi:peptide/nickel transport system ATP-binding protein